MWKHVVLEVIPLAGAKSKDCYLRKLTLIKQLKTYLFNTQRDHSAKEANLVPHQIYKASFYVERKHAGASLPVSCPLSPISSTHGFLNDKNSLWIG